MSPSSLIRICCCLILLPGCRKTPEQQQKRPDMQASFAAGDQRPLGMYVAYHSLAAAFAGYAIETNKQSFQAYFKEYTQYDYSRSGNVFCIFARQLLTTEEDVDAISDFVSNGNTLLVVSNVFNQPFLHRFHLRTMGTYSLKMAQQLEEPMRATALTMRDSTRLQREWYKYFYYPLSGQVFREESYPSQPIVDTYGTMPGAVVIQHGSGRLIVAANATALTNYFLLTGNNHRYLEQLLSYLPEEISSITWDTYYNKTERLGGDGGAFSELMKHEAMRWAFWLLLLLAATWIINGLIRRQRMIDVIRPNTNSSVEFAQTIGRLYLLKKDNKNIAAKMVTYFLEQLRSRYYISTGKLTQEFAQLLATKSGQPLSQAEQLLKTIEQIRIRDQISDIELLELNSLLKQFLK